MTAETTVFLAGFGGPESLDQVPVFVESVLGRKPPDHVIPGVVQRYETIGGGSPLPATTRRQAALLERELVRRDCRAKVHVGMLHAAPTITATAEAIASEGVDDVIVVSLAPYRCEVSTDAYEKAVADALAGRVASIRFAPDWNLNPRFVEALAETLDAKLQEAPVGSHVIFTAHSLPWRMIEQGDPYTRQLEETASAVAAELGLAEWELAYQSVSAAAREPWLRPSVEEVMDRLAGSGRRSVVVDPIGFISDHVETLYDNDVEHRAHAETVGIDFYRCRCLNDHPGLIAALADIVEGVV